MSLYLGENLISGVATPTEPSRNIGQIIQSTLPLTDAGLHLLDGSLILGGGIYQGFVDYIAGIYDPTANYFCTEVEWQTAVTTYGVCGKFVYDSVNNTVRLPKITGIIEGTTDVTALGDLVEAGLPNITGVFSPSVDLTTAWSDNKNTGAFGTTQTSSGNAYRLGNSSGGTGLDTDFNASRSSAIYGNSTTVQPQAIKVLYYIVIATNTKTEIEVDIDEVVTDLNGKADRDFTNCTNVANIKMAHNAMPSDTYVDLTLGADGTAYYAPADGFVTLGKKVTSAGQTIGIYTRDQNNVEIYGCKAIAHSSTDTLYLYVPVYKGQQYRIYYSAGGNVSWFRFVYAQGSESEAS